MTPYIAPGNGVYVHPFAGSIQKAYGIEFGHNDPRAWAGTPQLRRIVGMYIYWRFTGATYYNTCRVFKCTIWNCIRGISRASGYHETKDPLFTEVYNEMLDLFIKVFRDYLAH